MPPITTGIDIGTQQIKVLIATQPADQNKKAVPRILGAGSAETRGLHHGFIINSEEVKRGLREALKDAERSAGVTINNCRLAVGGVGMSSIVSTGKTAIARGDMEVSANDLKAVNEAAENEIPSSLSINRKIIHSIPLEYRLDGQPVLGSSQPLGLKGSNLEVSTLFITILEHHLTDLIEAVEDMDIKVIDVSASPMAASLTSLSATQKKAGCVLTNIGAETTSIVVFEKDLPVSLEVFPIGGTDITNDIALGLQIPLEEAEAIKIGELTYPDLPTEEIDKIVTHRLKEIFSSVNSHLKKIKRQGLLPAGIVITGGTASMKKTKEIAMKTLKLPTSVPPYDQDQDRSKNTAINSAWSVAYGLCIIGLSEDGRSSSGFSFNQHLVNTPKKFLGWLKQFLP